MSRNILDDLKNVETPLNQNDMCDCGYKGVSCNLG